MNVFRIRLGYDGTDFFGWQVQPGLRTVQGEVERALATVLDEPVRISGAGRTDRGVHAAGQVASFSTGRDIPAEALRPALRGLLPRDIVVSRVTRAPEGFHARRSALGRRYRYHLTERDTPVTRRYAWVRRRLPDLDLLSAASEPLLGCHRFDAFTVGEARRLDTTCDLRTLTWSRRGRGLACDLHADRFLYRMVRLIVGALVRLDQQDRLDPSVMAEALKTGEFDPALSAAPPSGLFFRSADYPADEDIVPVVNERPDVE